MLWLCSIMWIELVECIVTQSSTRPAEMAQACKCEERFGINVLSEHSSALRVEGRLGRRPQTKGRILDTEGMRPTCEVRRERPAPAGVGIAAPEMLVGQTSGNSLPEVVWRVACYISVV